MLKAVKIAVGLLLTALGVLWTLQGSDLIRIEPILCFADCEPLVGGSSGWVVAGLVSLAIGLFILVPRRRTRSS